MRVRSLFNPFKILRYLLNICQFRKIGRKPAFEAFVKCKHTRNVKAGHNCRFGADVYLETTGAGQIILGNYVELARHCNIVASDCIRIGDNSLVGEYTSIRDANHGFHREMLIRQQPPTVHPIDIGQDVWIGRGCAILKGVKIGDGAVVGANSVVCKDVEAFTVVAGNPAKFIKKR